MLVVETVARIRHEFYVQGKSIMEIVRDLWRVPEHGQEGTARSGEAGFAYERSVQPLPKLGPCAWLARTVGLLPTP